MLLQFNFKNYMSFQEEASFDFTATKITEFSNHIATVGREKVLPISVVYGANASGKSCFYKAFEYMHRYVACSFAFGDSDLREKRKKFPKPLPFLKSTNATKEPSMFEVYFIDSEEEGAKTYHYGFTVGSTGIEEEWLNYRSKSSRGDFKKIFYRNRGEGILDLSGIDKKSQENLKIALFDETLVVSLGSKLKVKKLQHIRDWFLSNEFVDFGQPIENLVLSKQMPAHFADNEKVQEQVAHYLHAFDKSIVGFDVQERGSDEDENSKRYKISGIHKIKDSEESVSIPFQFESAGTQKMFALYPFLQAALQNGGVLFVDELNARLHPLLVRNFIIAFLNPEVNKNHAQLIFTSHDSWQLNNNIFRRDEIWFTEKDENQASVLYSLADFEDEEGTKIRKDENHEKNYLIGKYGAIPTLKAFELGLE